MSNYTKVTDFAAKDSLLTGDPNKIIKGADFDAEFNSIQTAIATKADGNNPSITNGVINSTTIGATTPSTIVGTSVTSTLGFTGNLTGNVTGDLTGNVTAATGTTTLNDLAVGGSVTGTLNTADLSITGNITVSGTVDGRDVATDGAKLDGIEAGATGDQTAAEIKTAYESNADTNAYTDAEKTKLGTVETGADVTDATNVDAAGAVMNSDATTASMSFVIDEDNLASNLDTKVPTQQSVKAYVDATVVAIGGLTIDEPVATGEFGVFTSASTIGGQTPAQVRASLDLEVGTDVQAHDADLDAIAALTPTDGHFLQYSGGTWVGAEVQTDPTLATLTKTFTTNEQSTITLSSSLTGAPVVSVTKEVPQVGVSSGEWDVNSTTENYTRTNSAPATTLDFAGVFDVANATFLDTFDPSPTIASPRDVAFNTDGTKMLILADDADSVYQFTLSTAFDTSTASYDSVSFSVASQDSAPQSLAFNTDGTKMFVLGDTGNDVNEYTLSTGFDISTASFDSTFSVAGQDGQVYGLCFNNDGTKMYMTGLDGDDVNEYTLSTGFDVSTASFTQNFSVAAQDTTPRDVAFNADGTKMYVAGDQNDAVHIYNLSTGFDISTASFDTSFSVSAQSTSTFGIEFNADGTKMYIVAASDGNINQYELPRSLQLGTGSFASADVGKTIEANGGKFVLTATDGSYSETTAPTSYNQVASGDWGMYSVVYNTTDGDLELSGTALDTYDISTAVYSQNFTLTDVSQVEDMTFNDDGTKVFYIDSVSDDVSEYSLSTPFDVSTSTYVTNFSVSGQEVSPHGLTFGDSGTKMYVTGQSGDDVNQYDLTTAYDISTASYTTVFSVSSQDVNPSSVRFNTDGTKMFMLGITNKRVYQYSLSTAWSVATASYDSVFLFVGSEDANPEGLWFSTDGTKMFVMGGSNDTVYSYTLTTGFDLSTASYDSVSFSVTTEETNPSGVAFNNAGTKMYVCGFSGDDVNEYDIGSLAVPSGYSAVHTTASTDTTYWTDINSMTVDEAAGAGNVYYAVSTDDRTTWSVIDDTDGVRDIVRNNAGTWQYNSNGTYGSETWTNGTTNTELATLEEAMEEGINTDDASDFRIIFATDSGNASDFEMNTAGFTDIVDAPNQTTPDLNAFATFTSTVEAAESVSIATNNANCRTVSVNAAINASAYSQVSALSTTTVSLSGITVGSLLIYVASTTDHTASLSPPTGYTLINNAASTHDALFVFYKVADSTSENITNVGELDYLIEFTVAGGTPVVRSGTYVSSATESTSVFNLAGAGIVYPNQMDKTQLEAVTDPNHYTLGNDLDLAIVFNQTASGLAPSSDGVSINYDANTLEQGAVLGTDYNWDNPASDKVRITALQAGNYKVRVV